jgi:hypothetical protein
LGLAQLDGDALAAAAVGAYLADRHRAEIATDAVDG